MFWKRSSPGIVLLLIGCGAEPSAVPATSVPSTPAPVGNADEEYLRLHLALLFPTKPGWREAVEQLRLVGDEFTLVQLGTLDLGADQAELADGLRTAIHQRVLTDATEALPALLLKRLERAALADIQCHPLENRLGPWVLASIRAHADEPSVRAELERIRDHYEPSVEVRTVFATLSDRVVRYATDLLTQGESAALEGR